MYIDILLNIFRTIAFNKLNNTYWDILYKYITQDVLNDAYSKQNVAINMFKPLLLIPRPCKQYDRIVQKNIETDTYHKSFKLNSDFMAFRINELNPTLIDTYIDYIIDVTTHNKGYAYVQNNIMDNDKMIDIMQYVYVFIPSIGYIMEFQIGHPFSMYVLTNDSKIRNGDKEIIDLRKNDFYSHVLLHILGNAKYDIIAEAKTLYKDKEIPEALINILDTIK